ncbi:MAG TPA: response regulator [Polyangiaceae bacterium]|jgi:hypothetical protein
MAATNGATKLESMSGPLRVLLVDDDRDDYEITLELFEGLTRGEVALDWVSSYEAGLETIRSRRHDVYLVDYRLGEKTGLELLHEGRELRPEAAFIILTGYAEPELDEAAIRAGAEDFLWKNRLDSEVLERSVRHAFGRKRAEEHLKRQDELIRMLHRIITAANEAVNVTEAVSACVKAVCEFTGCHAGHVLLPAVDGSGAIIATDICYVRDPQQKEQLRRACSALRFAPGSGLPGQVMRTGQPEWVEDASRDPGFLAAGLYTDPPMRGACALPILVGRSVVGVIEFFCIEERRPDPQLLEAMRDIGIQLGRVFERSQARGELEQALSAKAQSEAHLAKILETNSDGIVMFDMNGELTFLNPAAERIFSLPPAFGAPVPSDLSGASAHAGIDALKDLLFKKTPSPDAALRDVHCEIQTSQGLRALSMDASAVHDGDTVTGILASIRDVTHIRKQELEHERLEQQLAHARKMEAIGRMAGGVAHDFNNLLTIIGNIAQFVVQALPEQNPLREEVLEIDQAAARGAELTRQLLAFSSKQVLNPRTIDLRKVVRDLNKMLARVMGAHIDLITVLPRSLPSILADPAQMEQVILNLAANARDAMQSGGVLRIRLEERRILTDEPPGVEESLKAGRYVVLSVEDSGHGMSEEVRARIFEPFFTTKPKDRGTGLGLSTVYGVVKQSGGLIRVESAPGRGSRFTLYFEAVASAEPELEDRRASTPPFEGHETILLAEDEPAVRRLAERILTKNGYRVLSAANGVAAMSLAREHAGPIDMLLSDMLMPQMSGVDLARALRDTRPTLKVLFMSGYSEDSLGPAALEQLGARLLAKPFNASGLLGQIRAMLSGSE